MTVQCGEQTKAGNRCKRAATWVTDFGVRCDLHYVWRKWQVEEATRLAKHYAHFFNSEGGSEL